MSSKMYFDSDDEFEVLGPAKEEKLQKENSDSDAFGESSEEEEEQKDVIESDSAPEDVGFEESKEITLQRVKKVMQQIRTDRQNSKLKRKQRDELYKQQKQQKLEALQKNRLPEDFLADLSTPQPVPQATQSDADMMLVTTPEDGTQEHSEDSGTEGGDEEGEDFLSLDKESSIQAVHTSTEVKKSQSSAERAADFRKQWLYGNRLNRQTMKQFKAQKEKRQEVAKIKNKSKWKN